MRLVSALVQVLKACSINRCISSRDKESSGKSRAGKGSDGASRASAGRGGSGAWIRAGTGLAGLPSAREGHSTGEGETRSRPGLDFWDISASLAGITLGGTGSGSRLRLYLRGFISVSVTAISGLPVVCIGFGLTFGVL